MSARSRDLSPPYKCTTRDGSLKGRRRRNKSFIKLKIVVFSPIPSANVTTAMDVNAGDLRSWRKANFRSFISFGAQCLNGVDKCGAARRDQTRHQCGDGQYNCGGTEQKWIVWRNLIKLSSDQPTERECRNDSDDQADNHRSHSLIHNQTQHVAGLSAERHAHADFAGALLDAVRDRAVDSNGREEERDPGEYA